MTALLDNLPPQLRAVLQQPLERLEALERENKLLREELRLLRLEKFGRKSDRLSDGQLALLEGEPAVSAAEVEAEAGRSPLSPEPSAPRPPRQHPGRQQLPAHLPRVEERIACSAEQCRCRQCGGEKKLIGYEQSEELAVKPAQYFVRVITREKRACPRCEELGVVSAPLPPKIIEKGKASNEMVVDVVIKKYLEHLPLYRQAASLRREAGIEVARMTLCGWVMATGRLLGALQRAMRQELLAGRYLQADETPVGVQSEQCVGRNHRAYFWQYSRPGGPVVFDFQMGRGREGPQKFLEGFRGTLQSDGYSVYGTLGGEGLAQAGCWAHARRGFVEAAELAGGEATAVAIVKEIGRLYAIEARAREAGLNHAARRQLRQAESVPVLAALREKIVAARQATLPGGALAKACDYALGQWERLGVYAADGEVEIDNNWCENAMRPLALGRKNWLHIGSEEAGACVAAIASVMESCRRLAINPRAYLLAVLPKLNDWPAARLAELTPAAWAKQQASVSAN